MAKIKPTTTSDSSQLIRPALTPEAEEAQMIALATNLVKKRLIEGTASSQETTHFLKLASMKNRLEMEKIAEENKLIRAKAQAIESAEDVKELYAEAIKAMKRYTGHGGEDDFDEDY